MTLPPVDREALVATRRDFHAHPELGFEEQRTSSLIAERLGQLGFAVRAGIGKTGVVGVKGAGRRCVLLRADMDALPVEEANDVPYRSRHAGRMHACGHDGHMAIGLETARRLAGIDLGGTVKFAFQPAEEISDGANAMIADGVLDQPHVDAAFGLHLWNPLPVGTIGITAGPVMASVDQFEITITGLGGHAAMPNLGIDPVLIASQVVVALQSLVSRRRDPFEPAVISVTQFHAGHAFNVIPEQAQLRGTVRTFGGQFFDAVPRLVEETARGVAAAHGGAAEVRYRRLSRPLVNDGAMTTLMRDVAVEVVGKSKVQNGVRTMGGEDMSEFLSRVPGCFAFVGSARTDGGSFAHHSPRFDIEEESLAIGAELLTRTALRYLAG